MRTRCNRSPWRAAFALAALALGSAPVAARADGFNARLFRPSGDAEGIGTLDGAKAPEGGALSGGVVSDLSLAPVVLHSGGDRRDIVSTRLVLEPQLMLGAGSSFGIYARAPFVAGDDGTGASGGRLDAAGVLPPSLGVLIPVTRQPLNDARVAVRAEVAAPIGSQDQFRNDAFVTGRFALVYAGPIGPIGFVASAGAQLAPVRGVGDARIGSAAIVGLAARFLPRRTVTGILSMEGRFDWLYPDQTSAFAGAGIEMRLGASQLRALGGVGIHDVIGTPRAMFSLAWVFDTSRRAAPAPVVGPEPVPPPAPPVTARQTSEVARGAL